MFAALANLWSQGTSELLEWFHERCPSTVVQNRGAQATFKWDNGGIAAVFLPQDGAQCRLQSISRSLDKYSSISLSLMSIPLLLDCYQCPCRRLKKPRLGRSESHCRACTINRPSGRQVPKRLKKNHVGDGLDQVWKNTIQKKKQGEKRASFCKKRACELCGFDFVPLTLFTISTKRFSHRSVFLTTLKRTCQNWKLKLLLPQLNRPQMSCWDANVM